MKRITYVLAFITMALALSSPAGWAQTVAQAIDGKVTREGQPLANAQVVLTSDTSRAFKAKTGKNGDFSFIGVPFGSYTMTVTTESGEEVARQPQVVGTGNTAVTQLIVLDITKEGVKQIRSVSESEKSKKMSKEEIKAEQAKVEAMNALIMKAQSAMQSQKWDDAETALKQVLAENPSTTRWELYKALADSQGRLNKTDEAIKTYQQGIDIAQAVAAGTAPKDPRNPGADPARAKIGAGLMMTSMGNAYVKLGKGDDAITLFKKAAEADANPSLAYFNLCAVYYNTGKYEDAAAACDKSIAANPAKADAWFFKGSALQYAGKPGGVEALNKYLEMDANGPYTAAAKMQLQKK